MLKFVIKDSESGIAKIGEVFTSLESFQRHLDAIAETSYMDGAYLKTFVAVIDDTSGGMYEARLDIQHPSCPHPDHVLVDHVRRYLDYLRDEEGEQENVEIVEEWVDLLERQDAAPRLPVGSTVTLRVRPAMFMAPKGYA